ncbi:hypothetical protein C8R45DRAFT_973175 [Mycena sanguinolenta]|nr:hypothetical protein C8R45DRAFT_973175 [Mycena sanguinolenta]
MELGRRRRGTRSWQFIIAVLGPVYLGGIAKSAVSFRSASENGVVVLVVLCCAVVARPKRHVA